jgi:hypothetical protein
MQIDEKERRYQDNKAGIVEQRFRQAQEHLWERKQEVPPEFYECKEENKQYSSK